MRRIYSFLVGVDWHLVRQVAEWRFVKSAYIWLFVVPLAARLLLPLAGEHSIHVPWIGSDGGKTFHLNIALPFSWQAFFFMALFFLIGWVLYLAACPEIVKLYKSFGDFRSAHAGTGKMNEYLKDAIDHASANNLHRLVAISQHDHQRRHADRIAELGDAPVPPDIRELVWEGCRLVLSRLAIPDENLCFMFDLVASVERQRRRKTCRAAALFFLVGGILFAWVAVESIVTFVRVAFF